MEVSEAKKTALERATAGEKVTVREIAGDVMDRIGKAAWRKYLETGDPAEGKLALYMAHCKRSVGED